MTDDDAPADPDGPYGSNGDELRRAAARYGFALADLAAGVEPRSLRDRVDVAGGLLELAAVAFTARHGADFAPGRTSSVNSRSSRRHAYALVALVALCTGLIAGAVSERHGRSCPPCAPTGAVVGHPGTLNTKLTPNGGRVD